MSEPKRTRRSRHASSNAEVTPELSQKISEMIASLETFSDPTVVIGDGWAALAAVGFLATATANRTQTATATVSETETVSETAPPSPQNNILWITHSGARAMPPLPFVESGVAAGACEALGERLGLSFGGMQSGHYLREFRHRSFARPAWHKSPTREMREQTREECVWGPEARILPLFEARFEAPLGEWDAAAREKLATLPNVRVLTDVPVEGFEFSESEGEPSRIVLATGAKLGFKRAIWADRWIGLGSIAGLPKGGALARNREPVGVLQAVFTHSRAMVSASMQEAFYGSLHKDAGDETSRATWGYFFDGGKKSVWTVFLTEEEGADNHSIGKKYRRMKQALDKMFTGTEWLPEGAAQFSATIAHEQLLFQNDFLFARGETVVEPQYLGKASEKSGAGSVAFVTDALGPSAAFEQVARLLADEVGLDLARFENPFAAAAASEADATEVSDETAESGALSAEEV